MRVRTAYLLFCLGVAACDPRPGDAPRGGPTPARSQNDAPPFSKLDADFLVRGVLTLKKSLGPEPQVLELRAMPRVIALQIERDGRIFEHRYEESEDPTEPAKLPPAEENPLVGQGDLSENIFPLNELNLNGIGRSFELARRAIDPSDGHVEKLIVRRYLPFGTSVRARIYVASPRMPGAIDTNSQGIPLKP